jgi:hypothetical protein
MIILITIISLVLLMQTMRLDLKTHQFNYLLEDYQKEMKVVNSLIREAQIWKLSSIPEQRYRRAHLRNIKMKQMKSIEDLLINIKTEEDYLYVLKKLQVALARRNTDSISATKNGRSESSRRADS